MDSAEKPKKKVSVWVKLFAVIVIVSMVGWVLAAWMGPGNPESKKNGKTIEVSGYTFYVLGDGTFATMYGTGADEIPVQFRLDPREAQGIPLESGVVPLLLASKKVYITLNPNQPDLGKFAVASAEISRITALYGINTIGAFTEDSDPPDPNVPLRTCDDADNRTKTSVVYINLGNSTEIAEENSCIYVTGETADDLILAADKLGYNLIGIKI